MASEKNPAPSLDERFPCLHFDRPKDGVLRITLAGPNINAVDPAVHDQLARVWPDIDREDEVREIGRAHV